MATERFEEVLRFLVKTGGTAELRSLAQEILDVGIAGEGAAEKVEQLTRELAQAERAKQTVRTYAEVRKELEATRKQLEEARKGFELVNNALALSENPSKQFVAGVERARKAIAQLEEQERKQAATVKAMRAELAAAGVDYRKLGTAQGDLANRARAAEAALREMAAQSRAARAEQESLAARTRAADEAFRRQATSSRTSAEALDKYRTKARQAAQDTASLGSSAQGSIGMLTRLRGVLGGLLGFLTLRGAVEGIKNIIGLGDAAEGTRVQLEQLYGSRSAANQALADLRKFSRENSLAFTDMLEAARRLKSFGIEPLDGTLQKLIDQNAKLGGGQERLQGIILALGQAWSKQKLQGEEILQLVERGVPVYDLLAKATGRNVDELQKLQVQGKLGRDVIRQLIDEMGRASEGAAAANVDRLSSRWAALVDRVKQFFTTVADSGALQFFKDQIAELTARIDEMAKSGALADFAKRVSDGIVSVATSVRDGVAAIIRYKDELLLLGQAYLTVKVAGFVSNLLGAITALKSATVATQGLNAATLATSGGVGRMAARLAAIPRLLKIGLIAIGFDLVLNQAIRLKQELENLQEANKLVADNAREAAMTQAELIRRIAVAKDIYAKTANEAIVSSDELAKKSQTEAEAYLQRLQQAQQYFRALQTEARLAGDAAGLAGAREKLAALAEAIVAAKNRVGEAGKEIAAQIDSIGQFGAKAAETFDTLRAKGDSARKAVDGLFKGLELTTDTGLTKVVDALAAVSARGTEAGEAIRSELREQILKLSDEDFPKFLAAAQNGFFRSVEGAAELGRVVGEINLARLGVDVGKLQTGFTAAGRAATVAFAGAVKEIQALGLSAKQESQAVATAFTNALAKASTKAEIESLRTTLVAAFKSGQLEAGAFAQALSAIGTKLATLGTEGRDSIAKIGDGADVVRQKLIASLEAARADVAAKANQIAADLAAALKNGAPPDIVSGLQREYAALDAQIVALNGDIEKQREQLTAAGNAGTNAARAQTAGFREASAAAKDAGAAAEGIGTSTEKGAAMSEVQLNGLAGFITQISAHYRQQGGEIEAMFDRLVEHNKGVGRSITQWGQFYADAAFEVQESIDGQVAAADSLIARYTEMGQTGRGVGASTAAEFERAARQMGEFATAVRNGTSSFQMLDKQRLDQLAAALDQARAKTAQLAAEAASARAELDSLNDSLQDRQDQASGNEEAIAERNFQRELERINALAEKGGAEAQQAAQEARGRLQALHAQELEQIRNRRAAERQAEQERLTAINTQHAAESGTGGGGVAQPARPAATGGGIASGGLGPRQPGNQQPAGPGFGHLTFTLDGGPQQTVEGSPEALSQLLQVLQRFASTSTIQPRFP